MNGDYTVGELMAAVIADDLKDGEVAAMGAVSMIPMSACRLAQYTHAPNLWYIAGAGGAINSQLEPLVLSSCDYANLKSDGVISFQDILTLEGKGAIDVFFAGGMQIDMYGNCNLICIGDYDDPVVRGPGTVGLTWLPKVKRVVIYSAAHTNRIFVEKVDFNSGPGFLSGPEAWGKENLQTQGPALVVTPLCVMDFEPESKRMRLKSVHPGVSVEQVKANTGFELIMPDKVVVTPVPTAEQLAIMSKFDPSGILKGVIK